MAFRVAHVQYALIALGGCTSSRLDALNTSALGNAGSPVFESTGGQASGPSAFGGGSTGIPEPSAPAVSTPEPPGAQGGGSTGAGGSTDVDGSAGAAGSELPEGGGGNAAAGVPEPVVNCTDSMLNGDETGLDCGGSCPGCDGDPCSVGQDCVSERCAQDQCSSCADETRTDPETDVDCGGGVCPGCGLGNQCNTASDCQAASVCNAGECSLCGNGSLDAGEQCDAPSEPQTCTATCQVVCVPGCTCATDPSSPELHVYAFCMQAADWTSARDSCTAAGSELVRIETAIELSWVRAEADAQGILGEYWLGANDLAAEGTFVWADGSPVQQFFWSTNEPNNAGEENCVSTTSTNEFWNDARCAQPYPFVCERG